MAESPKTYFEKRRAMLKQDRDSWVARAQDIARYVAPEYDRFNKTESNANRDEARHDAILDSTATLASETFASGLRSGSSNPAREWFSLATVDGPVEEGSSVARWLYEKRRLMLWHYQRSNFYKACVPFYREGGLFGTSVMYQCEHPDDFMRFHNYAPGEYYLACDHFGTVNTCYRDFAMTTEQLITQFGAENCSDRAQRMFKNGRKNDYVQVCHAIEPRTDSLDNVDEFIPRGAQYRSVYFELSGTDSNDKPKFLKLGYFWEFPIWTYRIGVVSTNTYGFGRAHMCLGDIKQLQEETRQRAAAVEKMVNPPIKAPSGTDISQIGLQPGEISLYDAALGAQAFGPLYQVNLDIAHLDQTIMQLQQRINDTFFVGTFQPLTQLDRREITAREVDERVVEKFTALGPVFDPLEDGAFDVGTNRTFGMMARAGMLDDAPEELQGRQIRGEYQSITSEAQRAGNAMRIERITQYVGGLFAATQDQSVWDSLDKDEMVSDYAESIGLPPDNIVPEDGVADMRQQREQMQYAQQAISMAGEAAKATRNLGTADTSGKNALTDLARMAGTSPEEAAV